MLFQILEKIDYKAILEEYLKLEQDIQWTYGSSNSRQAGLQHVVGEDPWTSAVGKSKGNESSYTEVNPFFKGTIFEEIITKYDLRRTRLMWVGKRSCYSMHQDETQRVHIPLITNPDAYFVFKLGKVIHIPAGIVAKVDTRQYHTFMNCSDYERLHLVGVVEV